MSKSKKAEQSKVTVSQVETVNTVESAASEAALKVELDAARRDLQIAQAVDADFTASIAKHGATSVILALSDRLHKHHLSGLQKHIVALRKRLDRVVNAEQREAKKVAAAKAKAERAKARAEAKQAKLADKIEKAKAEALKAAQAAAEAEARLNAFLAEANGETK